MREEPVTIIDREVLKVLSVDTRMDIIKLLSDGGRTPSFVAKKLNKSDATIVEHLHAMCEAGLVKKTMAPGKKWVFYSLTERGKGIISSHSRRLVIVLATSFIAFFAGVASMFGYVQNSAFTAGINAGFSEATKTGSEVTSPMLTGAPAALPAASPLSSSVADSITHDIIAQAAQNQHILMWFAIALFAIAAAGFAFYFYKKAGEENQE